MITGVCPVVACLNSLSRFLLCDQIHIRGITFHSLFFGVHTIMDNGSLEGITSEIQHGVLNAVSS